jgi:hypothetical protein
VGPVWILCGFGVDTVWSLSGICNDLVGILCGFGVDSVRSLWNLCGSCADSEWILSGLVWVLCGVCVDLLWNL